MDGQINEKIKVWVSSSYLLCYQLWIGVVLRPIVAGWDAPGLHIGINLFQFLRHTKTEVGLALVNKYRVKFGVDC